MEENNRVPPPPEKPDAYECCGSGCSPCIFDYYDRALAAWVEQYGDPSEWSETRGKNQ